MTDVNELMDAEYARVLALDAAYDAEHLMQRGGVLRRMLEKARDEAISAMETMISMRFFNEQDFYAMQRKVWRYDDLVRFITEIVEEGDAVAEEAGPEEAESIRQALRGEEEDFDHAD